MDLERAVGPAALLFVEIAVNVYEVLMTVCVCFLKLGGDFELLFFRLVHPPCTDPQFSHHAHTHTHAHTADLAALESSCCAWTSSSTRPRSIFYEELSR
jgi:hypothetical protein